MPKPTAQFLDHSLPLLRLDKVSVTLNGRRILKDLTWRLMPGQHWAVLGANGAGKTTFLSLARGDLWPDQAGGGAREYGFGQTMSASPIELKQRMGTVSDELQQRYLRFGWDLRGEEVVATGFFDTPMLYQPLNKDQKRRLDALFLMQGLGELRTRRFLSLSQGEARKLLLARALATLDLGGGPCLLVLDEVCEGLDPLSRHGLLTMIEQLTMLHSGLHLLLTAHRQEDVPDAVSHVLALDAGRMAYQGPRPADLGRLLAAPQARDMEPPRAGPLESPVQGEPRESGDEPLFELRGCDVYRGRAKVLKDLTWLMLPGENWAVLGHNGAGKSTFLELLHGDLHPALGGVVTRFGQGPGMKGRDEDAAIRMPLKEARSRMGQVSPALQALFLAREGAPLSGEECVLSGFFGHIGLYARPSEAQKEAAARWMALLGISDLAQTHLDRLSFGQLRRLLLARAMVAEPRVLLLDEPCSGLDSESRDRMLALLSLLADQGTALVLATHREDEMVPQINRVLRLEAGRITHAAPRNLPERAGGGQA